MASGYEKAECGVDPNYGWRGEPDSPAYLRKIRRHDFWLMVFAVVYSAIFWFAMFAPVVIPLWIWLTK